MSDRKEALFGLFARLSRRRKHHRIASSIPNRRQFESLESRCLPATDAIPAIEGMVYLDTNANTTPDIGEEIAGAAVQLFQDDGDGIFEPGGDDVQVGAEQTTDANGHYVFESLDSVFAYFVVQPCETVDTLSLSEQVSPLIDVSTPNLIIDAFETNQAATADPPAPSSDGSTLGFADETEVIGGERDLFVELESGVGELQLLVNPFNLLEVLQFNASSGVEGSAFITWDGQDADANPTPSMGLGGRDLTQGGINTGFAFMLGIDTAGMGDALTLSLFQGDASNVSSASVEIPVTDGTATAFLFIPFSDFSGPVSPTNVDAIQMTLGMNSVPSADGQVSFVGVLGAKQFDIANEAGADLAITKSNEVSSVVPGEMLTYEITVQNLGPQDVVGASVQDSFPTELTDVSYTSTTIGTVSGNTVSGSGDIDDLIDIAAGSSVIYNVTVTVDPSAAKRYSTPPPSSRRRVRSTRIRRTMWTPKPTA